MEFLEVVFNEKEHKRFFRNIIIDEEKDCWNWQGAKDDGGYGFGFYRGHKTRVHRIIYAFFRGPIQVGRKKQLDHLCRNRACCNPEHLELVTQKENILRGIGPTAVAARKKLCKYGHPLTRTKTNRRECKTCDSIRHKKRYEGPNREYWLQKSREAAKRHYDRHLKMG